MSAVDLGSEPRAVERTVVVLQPGYLPWLGFFDQMQRADVFVLYDDVAYDKHGWRNRNRIKSSSGPHWLTVPARVDYLGQRILDIRIDSGQPWTRKHLGTIRQFYGKAPYLSRYLPELEEILSQPWELLVDLDLALIERMARWLAIDRPMVRSSELGIRGDRSRRLVDICSHFKAARYISGNAAKRYLDVDLFTRHGIAVEWQEYEHPVYPQLHGPFVPYLSVLDLLMNCGDESAAVLSSTRGSREL